MRTFTYLVELQFLLKICKTTPTCEYVNIITFNCYLLFHVMHQYSLFLSCSQLLVIMN